MSVLNNFSINTFSNYDYGLTVSSDNFKSGYNELVIRHLFTQKNIGILKFKFLIL